MTNNKHQHILDRIYRAAIVCEELEIFCISYRWSHIKPFPGSQLLVGTDEEFEWLRRLLLSEGYEELGVTRMANKINERYYPVPRAWLNDKPLL